MVNETLYQYINRSRLEKAANLLVYNHDLSITEAALQCGFSDSAVFARAFKKFYRISASKYRVVYSKKNQKNSKNCKDHKGSVMYHNFDSKIDYHVEVKSIEDMTAVYMRYTGPYKNNQISYKRIIQKLVKWAQARELFNSEDPKLFSIYHDNPDITQEAKQRTSICLEVSKHTAVEGEVGKMTIKGGKYAIGHFEIHSHQFEQAWMVMYGEWLPSSGYQACDRPYFEMYKNHPDNHPENKSIVEIYLPVKPL